MFDRSAAVKLQLRDAKGRFIKMGSHVKWTSLSSGNDVSGIVRGEVGNNVVIEFQHAGKPYTIHVPHTKLNVINEKAQLDPAYVQKMGGHVDTPGINEPGVTPGHAASTPNAPTTTAPAAPIKNFATLSTNETYYRIGSADGQKINTPVADLKVGDEVMPIATASVFQKSPYNAKANGTSATVQKFGPGLGKVVKIKDGAYATIEDDKGKQWHVSASHFVLKRDSNTEKAVLDAQKLEAATIHAGKTPPSLPWIDSMKSANAPAAPAAPAAPSVPDEPAMPLSQHVHVADMPVGATLQAPYSSESDVRTFTKVSDGKWKVEGKSGTLNDGQVTTHLTGHVAPFLSAPPAAPEAAPVDATKQSFPDKGKSIKDSTGADVKVNDMVHFAGKGVGKVMIVLPSTDSVRVMYPDGTEKVHKFNKITKVEGDAPKIDALPSDLNVGDSGVDPNTHTAYIVGANGTLLHKGDTVTHSSGDKGTVAAIYKGEKTVKVTWDDGHTTGPKKASTLEGEAKHTPDASAPAEAPATPAEAPIEAVVPYSTQDENALVNFKDNFMEIGEHLRGSAEHAFPNAGEIIHGLDDLISKSVLTEDAVAYRGFVTLDPKVIKDLVPGHLMYEKSFTSTSLDPNIAIDSLDLGPLVEAPKNHAPGMAPPEVEHSVIVKFELPKGSFGHQVNYDGLTHPDYKQDSHEKEVILPRAYNYQIKEVTDGTDPHGRPLKTVTVTAVHKSGADDQNGPGMHAVEANAEVGSKPFKILEDPGADGDGFHPSGPWGHFGASGVMVEAPDPQTGEMKYLIVENGDLHEEQNRGLWQLPGGAANGNENPYQAAAREMHEELEVDPSVIGDFEHAGDVAYANGKGWAYTNIGAKAPKQFDMKLDGYETSGAKWVTADELRGMRDNGSLLPAFGHNVDNLLAVYQPKDDGKTPEEPNTKLDSVSPAEDLTPAETQDIADSTAQKLASFAESVDFKIHPAFTSFWAKDGNPLVAAALEHMGISKNKPVLVSDAEFAKLKEDGHHVVYRGISGVIEGQTPLQAQQDIVSSDSPKIGNGLYGGGTYFTNNPDAALHYGHSDGAVSTYALTPEAKMVSMDDIEKIRDDIKAELGDKATPKVSAALEDVGFVAAMSGFDGIFIPGGNGNDNGASNFYTMLNRGTMVHTENNIVPSKDFKFKNTDMPWGNKKESAFGKAVPTGNPALKNPETEVPEPVETKSTEDLINAKPLNIEDFKIVPGKESGGSNSGNFYTDKDGTEYYIKYDMHDGHARDEILASKIYQSLGVNAANQEMIKMKSGKIGVASKIIKTDGHGHNIHLNEPEYRKEAQKDFAVDALLANWDVAGIGNNNLLTDANGKPLRLDPGAALRFRAQGASKSDFGPSAKEWDFLRTGANAESSSIKPTAKLFGDMTDEQLKESASKLNELTDTNIDSMVDSVGYNKKDGDFLKETLKARRDDILKRAGVNDTANETGAPHETGQPAGDGTTNEAGPQAGEQVPVDPGTGTDSGAPEAGTTGIGEPQHQVGDFLDGKGIGSLPVGSKVENQTNKAILTKVNDTDWLKEHDTQPFKQGFLDHHSAKWKVTEVAATTAPDAPADKDLKSTPLQDLAVGSSIHLSTGNWFFKKREDGDWEGINKHTQYVSPSKYTDSQMGDFLKAPNAQWDVKAPDAPESTTKPVWDGKTFADFGKGKVNDLPVGTRMLKDSGTHYFEKRESGAWQAYSIATGEEMPNKLATAEQMADMPDHHAESYTLQAPAVSEVSAPESSVAMPDTKALSDYSTTDIINMPVGTKLVKNNGSYYEKVAHDSWQQKHATGKAMFTFTNGDTNAFAALKNNPDLFKEIIPGKTDAVATPSTPASAPGTIHDPSESDLSAMPEGTVLTDDTMPGYKWTKEGDQWSAESPMGGDHYLPHSSLADGGTYNINPDAPQAPQPSQSGIKAGDKVLSPELLNLPIGSVVHTGNTDFAFVKVDKDHLVFQTMPHGTKFKIADIIKSNEGKTDETSKFTVESMPAGSTPTDPAAAVAANTEVGDTITSAEFIHLPVGAEVEDWDGIIYSKTGPDEFTTDYGAIWSSAKMQKKTGDLKVITVQQGAPEADTQPAQALPSVPGKTGEPISVGDDIVWSAKGTTGTVVEIDQTYGKVRMLMADGTKKWYASSKMVKQPSKSAAPYVPKNVGGDPSSPLYGQPKPTFTPATYPAGPTSYLPDGFVAEIEQRYASKINPSWTKASPQDSFYWSKVVDFQNTGNPESLQLLHDKLYISDAMFDKAKNSDFAQKKAAVDAQNAKSSAEYEAALKDWKAANGKLDGIELHFPELASKEWDPATGLVTNDDGTVSANWSMAPAGSYSVESILSSMQKDDVLSSHGISAMIDSDWIRDNNVRFTKVVDENGVTRVQARFEVSELHKKDVINAMGNGGDSKYGIKTGFLGYIKKGAASFSHFMGGGESITSSSHSGNTYKKLSGTTSIEFQAADDTGQFSNNTSALSAAAYITMPENATSKDLESALKAMGVTDAHPSPKESVDFSKKKQLVSSFRGFVGEGNTKYEKDPQLLDQHVKEALIAVGGEHYTLDDFPLVMTDLGFYQFKVPTALRDEMTAKSGVKALVHGNIDWLPETYNKKDAVKYVSQVKDHMGPLRVMKRFTAAGGMKGYLSTARRMVEGDNAKGMSPGPDIKSGGARYLFTTPVKDNNWKTNTGYDSGVVAHPSLAFQYLGNYANYSDHGDGSREEGTSILGVLSAHQFNNEAMILNGIGVKDTWYTFTNSDQKPKIISELHAAGVSEINGMPIEQYFVVPGVDPVPAWVDPHA